MYKSPLGDAFRNKFSEDIFVHKYRHEGAWTWPELAHTLVEDVCRDNLSPEDKAELKYYISSMKFIPGGRYLYYAGRKRKYFNNCYLFISKEDSREDWANLSWKAESCLTTGGGIGNDYSIYRARNSVLHGTGGQASGPISKMKMINEIGREVMQGGSRRSAIYASLNHLHPDIQEFLNAKNWQNMPVAGTDRTFADVRKADFNFPCPLDMTNISVNYDTSWLMKYWSTGDVGSVFKQNSLQAMKTGEPGFSFNFFYKENETGRNAPLAGNTWVMTNKGYVQIKDIVDKEIIVWTGYRFAPTTFKKTKENVPTVIVEMTGKRKITADLEHEFLVEDSHRIERIPACKLKQGDILVTPFPDVAAFQNPNPTQAYTLGYLYGDGSFSYKGTAEVTICTESKRVCIPYFNKEWISSTTDPDSRGYARIYFKAAFDKKASKEIYPFIPMQEKAAFIAGLFDADGSSNEDRICLGSQHYAFLEHVRRDLEVLGIVSNLHLAGISTYGQKQGYLLVVAKGSFVRFGEIIHTHRIGVYPGSDKRPKIKVVSVTEGSIEDVYCCDVGFSEHSFMTEGVLVSNCTEVTTADDSDVCNLGSINFSRIENIKELKGVVELATKFLMCGTLVADLPYSKVAEVREKNRRLGLGLMGLHEWLIQRNFKYEVKKDLHRWLAIYCDVSRDISSQYSAHLSISQPVANRAIAPTGSIGILASTTTGIEPIYAVAVKRRYLKGTTWKYQYVVDGTAQSLIERYGINPEGLESSVDLAKDYRKRIKFQCDVQDYVDMGISSTINLPAWGTEYNNEDRVEEFTNTLAEFCHRLRGFTCYPDGSRGGQPLVSVPYSEAVSKLGVELEENTENFDICSISGKGGHCGT